MGVANEAFELGYIQGVGWMILSGLGAFLAYVPIGSVLFDRVIATTRFRGNAVFAIYLVDSFGYTGAVVVQIFKDLFAYQFTRFEFLSNFTRLLSIGGGGLVIIVAIYFMSQTKSRSDAAT